MNATRTWSTTLASCTALLLVAGAVQGTSARAQTVRTETVIENTALVTYDGGAGSATVTSNTVTVVVGSLPSDAVIEFFSEPLPGEPGGIPLPTDGGMCRDASGDFGPLPGQGAAGIAPEASDTRTYARASTYRPGQRVLVVLTDANRNADPEAREYVEVRITTDTGDEEVLQLQETGVDTGVFAAGIPSREMPPPPTPFDCALSVAAETVLTAYYVDPDFPGDTATTTAVVVDLPEQSALYLLKSASVPEVSAGDFLQYRLQLENRHGGPAPGARLVDTLPHGLRYQAGSLRVDGQPRPDPAIGADGRTLTIPLGTLAPSARVAITYVVEVGADVRPGQLVNRARADGDGGLVSNVAEAAVRVVEPLFTSHFTIIGRVVVGACDADGAALEGVPGVRLVLDDGTYVPTDPNGTYHFEGVRPGTHVVQIDPASLPPGLEAVACARNTRFAGRAASQFVEAQGGSLWRADFHLRRIAVAPAELGMRFSAERTASGIRYVAQLDGGAVPATGLRATVMLPDGAAYAPGSATLDGAAIGDPVLAGGVATFALGDPGADWARRLAFSVTPPAACPDGGWTGKAFASFDGGGKQGQRTPPAVATLPCGAGARADSGRQAAPIAQDPAADEAASPSPGPVAARGQRGDGDTPTRFRDWLTGQAPGNDWLLPVPGQSVGPTQPVVVKHAPGQKVVLYVNGTPVGGQYYNGSRTNADRTVSVTMWRGVPMTEGDNLLRAEITGPGGAPAGTIEQTARYANAVVRAQLVPEQSVLVADGLTRPVIAVRMLDTAGKPVREGIHGTYSVRPPHASAQAANMQQQRQLAGMESFAPTWVVEGDDGVAYIELQPTTTTGQATLAFEFRLDRDSTNEQELEVWLKSEPRDWIVVGFAAGTIGHDTLEGNMEALAGQDREPGITTEGQLSLYAKGRVLGRWMLTLAYDSDKPADRLRREGLLSTIDPDRFYTLYGDGTAQGHDAASARKLYVKLERDQFYALFGDFTTGLDDGELTRYHRALNGLKVEYQGPVLEFNGFAAETEQNFVRDELQGNGTSGLYRLSRDDVLINGERVRIETRDRFRSELVLETRVLTRHIDYDIDYGAGTLFFREPIPSRDFGFNPVFIVVEYETLGTGEKHLSAGGRVGAALLEGRLRAGVTYLTEGTSAGDGQLAGVDLEYAVSERTEVRAEAARSDGEAGGVERDGDAYLVELEHHGERFDLLAYVRQQDEGFGLNQQNASERGMFKAGVDGQWRIADGFALQGQAYHQEALDTGLTREALSVQAQYRTDLWGARAGLQWVRDQAPDGRMAESRQVTLGANRRFMEGRLDLSVDGAFSVGGRNDSVDFPTRVTLGASYAITDTFRLTLAQEFTDGEDRDTSTTRFGFQAEPWAGALLSSTLNQSQISEYGPRTFGLFGLKQTFLVGTRWSVDVSADTSRSFNESGDASLVVNPAHPIASGGIRDGGALTEDFVALSGGVTYRTELWSWNARLEGRDGERSDRRGFTSSFLRQATDGIALLATAQAFAVDHPDGSQGLLANASLSFAYRPLGSHWSILDRLEFRSDELLRGTGEALLGNDTLAVRGDARSRRLVNNFVLNYVGDAWTEEDRRGNLFDVAQRSQLSLYYGSKYVFDTYDGEDFAGYTDILGVEWRHDLSPKYDVGLRASVRHSWDSGAVSYAFGPSFGFTPFTNAWFSLGYNVVGFTDRDFEAMHYTAQGPYLMMRFKFDQETFGLVPGGAGQGR